MTRTPVRIRAITVATRQGETEDQALARGIARLLKATSSATAEKAKRPRKAA